MSPVDLLSRTAGRPDDLAVVEAESGERLTYRELSARVEEVATGGVEEVATRGEERVFLVIEPDIDGIIRLLACWRRGKVAVLLNPKLTEAERTDAAGRLDDASFPPETQVVLWTSGTTGRPRGVALSFANLEASAQAARERLGLSAQDVWLASLSPAHVGGLAIVTRSLLLGGTLVSTGTLDAARMSALLDGEAEGARTDPAAASTTAASTTAAPPPTPTHISLVPTQLLRILDHRGERRAAEALKCALIGGAHAPAALVNRAVAAGWPIALTYGATEMSSQIATATPDVVRARPGTVGPPLPGVSVRVEPDGELLARGPTRALGYVAGGEAESLADADGWYHTGDLGRVDDEGRLWITGRRADRIVTGGVTIDAHEIEEALRSHPTVLDACVVGIPDDEWGERVGAWVDPVVGEFDVERIETWLRRTLTAAKLPRVWYVAGSLPRNVNGKVDRSAVRRALSSHGRGREPPQGL